MAQTRYSRYQCFLCTKMRSIQIPVSEHLEMVANSPNGLVFYSDLHRCDEGILAINNAFIDIDFAIRSFSSLELPDKRNPLDKGLLSIPIPQTKISKEYMITEMLPKKGLRLIIEDNRLDAIINIGRILPKKERPIARIESDLGSIILDYYPSDLNYNTNLDKWLNILVNQLELLPVTRVGLFIETLRFIHGLYQKSPDAFQIVQLQTILSSHETYFKVLMELNENEGIDRITAKYGEVLEELIRQILTILTNNPKFNLKEIALVVDKDLVYLIFTLLIMEQEGLVEIRRPVIINDG